MIVLAALLVADQTLPVEILAEAGYKVMVGPSYSEGGGSVSSKVPDGNERADDRQLTIKFSVFTTPALPLFRQNREIEGTSQALLSAFKRDLPSKFPAGSDVLLYDDKEILEIRLRTTHERVDITMREPLGVRGSGTGASVQVLPSDRATEIKFAEKCARVTLARCAARRLGQESESVSLNGHTVHVRRHNGGANFVDLDDWQVARGFSETYDKDICVSVMKRGNTEITIPLAGQKVRVNGEWKSLPDIVMLRDGRWFASLESMESLL